MFFQTCKSAPEIIYTNTSHSSGPIANTINDPDPEVTSRRTKTDILGANQSRTTSGMASVAGEE